ncbi:hypothetical protein ZWY2020_031141 [Hordeum vulgare]|nr:hypothetical protein ZWY2020_031141 [Hordeum vulgare]
MGWVISPLLPPPLSLVTRLPLIHGDDGGAMRRIQVIGVGPHGLVEIVNDQPAPSGRGRRGWAGKRRSLMRFAGLPPRVPGRRASHPSRAALPCPDFSSPRRRPLDKGDK